MTRELILAAANNQINKAYECLIRGDNLLLHYNANPAIPNNQGFTVYDIHNGTYHRFLDRQFEKQQEESLDLMGSSNVEDNYYYFSDDYGYTV